MFNLVSDVLIEDESLRDGLQGEKRSFSVEEKQHFIRGMEACGVRRIQVGSFVHPQWVPQMANTDELFSLLEPAPGVTYTALVLNDHGLDRRNSFDEEYQSQLGRCPRPYQADDRESLVARHFRARRYSVGLRLLLRWRHAA